jgi:hypothetical protein
MGTTNMVISSFYFHIKINIQKSEQEKFKKYICEKFNSVAKILFRQDTEINIEIEEGSVKARIAILAGALYIAIGNYGSFRTGVNQIIEDSKLIKSIVLESLIKDGTMRKEDIIVSKKINAVPEALRKLTLKIDRLEKNYYKNDNEKNRREMRNIIMSLDRILTNIENKNDFEFIINGVKSDILPDLNQFNFDERKCPTYIKTKDDDFIIFNTREYYETHPAIIEEKKKYLIDKREKK